MQRTKFTTTLDTELLKYLKHQAIEENTDVNILIEQLIRLKQTKGRTKMTPTAYRTENIDPAELTATDLRAEIEPGQEVQVEATLVTFLNADEQEITEKGQLLWFPAPVQRAGIVWGGNAVWTDADSIEDALNRYLNDEMIP